MCQAEDGRRATASISSALTKCPATNEKCNWFQRNDIVDDDVGGAVVARGTASISLI